VFQLTGPETKVLIGHSLGSVVAYEAAHRMTQRWVNIADRDDFIAAEPDLKGLFGAGMPTDAAFEDGYTVDNGASPHNFYLGKARVGRPVGELFRDAVAASSA
jgi:hypothetical protein